jgi:NAD(P) transhydrogenase subunit beta
VDLQTAIKVAYLAAAVLFILGLKRMAHPRTAVGGNVQGAVGMALAVGATLLDRQITHYGLIGLGGLLGTVIGVVLAQRIQMTAMPQLVALLNGLGGAASVLVAGAELTKLHDAATDVLVAIAASGLIGAVTFWGSLVAYGKLQELKMFR